MSAFLILKPLDLRGLTGRGSGIANLGTADPKEVWVDSGEAGAAAISVDLGELVPVDTILLGSLRNAAAAARWSISGGVARDDEFVLQGDAALRVPDSVGQFAAISHALYNGAVRQLRYLRLTLTPNSAGDPLSAGVLAIGQSFVAQLGQEWGFGRQPIDTGTATALPSGGYVVVEGVVKRGLSWTFGDLTVDEADRLEALALLVGETKPVVVVENADRTSGLRGRIHYCKFGKWKPFERRNRVQTKWELSVEEWL